MNRNYTHFTVILDRSGSMQNIAKDMEGGLNTLIEEQKKEDGKCTFSLYKFDDVVERDFFFAKIQSVGQIDLLPRGATALNDCLAKAIVETGEYLRNLPETERPGLVSVVIVTDGYENASKEYKDYSLIKKMIQEQESKYNWQFTYLGSNQDSMEVAQNYGLDVSKVSNYSANKASNVFRNTSGKLSAARSVMCAGGDMDLVYDAFQYNNKDKEELL
jgi:uncharacterized protein YegL